MLVRRSCLLALLACSFGKFPLDGVSATSEKTTESDNLGDNSVSDSNYSPVFYTAKVPGIPNFSPLYDKRPNDKLHNVIRRASEPELMSAEMSAPKPVMVKPDSIPALEPPSSLEAESDQNVAESRYENMQVSYKKPPPRPNKPRHRRKGPSVDEVHQETNRRSGDSTYKVYDPRAPPDSISTTPRVYPVPLEFLNQIPGSKPNLEFLSQIPGSKPNLNFIPSSQIEKVVNGIPTLVHRDSHFTAEDNSDIPGPPYAQYLQEPVLPPVTPKVIYRDEYPSPKPKLESAYPTQSLGLPPAYTPQAKSLAPPYPPIPYHDSRLTSPRTVSVSTPGSSGALNLGSTVQPGSTVRQAEDSSSDKALRYIEPPQQASLNFDNTYPTPTPYGVPTPYSSPSPYPPTTYKVKKGGKPSFGYFPPANRVMPRVSHIEAECRDDFMKLRVAFNDSFAGLIYSAGYTHDNDCMYINGTGSNVYEFYIQLNRCGTLGGSDHHKRDVANKQTTKNFMWNTVTIQYNPLIEEEWDEHFKVTCEYGYDFWKTVTFPFLEVETNTADPVVFTLTPPECFMEIRNGYGLTGTRVSGPVHVGDPVTLLIYMRSQWDGFDMVVNDCVAHNGANKRIQLIDHNGCPVDEKLIAKFQGTWAHQDSMYETVIYANMKTFRFTGTPALYIECDIRMCHGSCPTPSCNWRDGLQKVRKRRSAGNSTMSDEDQEDDYAEGEEDDEEKDERKTTTVPPGTLGEKPFSESLSLFQSLQVLANEEDEKAFRNQTLKGVPLSEGEVCLSTLIFTTLCGGVSAILLLSGVTISLMCIRVRRRGEEKGDQEVNVNTLRSGRTSRSDYVHSPQARIP